LENCQLDNNSNRDGEVVWTLEMFGDFNGSGNGNGKRF